MPKLTVIILSFNTKELTKQCLDSLIRSITQNKRLIFEIIVVDNASHDGSTAMLTDYLKHFKKENGDLKIVLNKTNVGFTKGNNQGLKLAGGTYVLFLNSDILIQHIDFGKLLDYLDTHEKVAALTVKVILPSGKIDQASHRGFPTVWNSFAYFGKLEKLLGRIPFFNFLFGGYHLTYKDLHKIHEIDSPSGAFYLVRKSLLDRLGGFDEDFFMYGEDIDLSYRIKKLGYQILYYPLYEVIHYKYKSGLSHHNSETKKKTNEYFFEAMKIFFRKHYASSYPPFLKKLIYSFIDLKKRLS